MESTIAIQEEHLPSKEVFTLFQTLIKDKLGIHLPAHKRVMLGHRLMKRVNLTKAGSFSDYYRFINHPENTAELSMALELITTNETYFFREHKHFEYLQNTILPGLKNKDNVKLWCAACSTGEEPYTIAMVLKEYLKVPWQLMASDVNLTVIDHARKAIYTEERASKIPLHFKQAYCRRGVGEFSGFIRVKPELRKLVHFFKFNLLDSMYSLGMFGVIFLRNVMIYFDDQTKQKIITHISRILNPNGYLFISHSETLHGIDHPLTLVSPSIYQRPV